MIATLDDDSHASRSPFGRINHPDFVIDQLHFGEVRIRNRQGFSQGVVERIYRSVTFGDNVFDVRVHPQLDGRFRDRSLACRRFHIDAVVQSLEFRHIDPSLFADQKIK